MQIECGICCRDMVGATEDTLATICSHGFHKKCLNDWLLRSGTCPICLFRLRKEHCIPIFLNSLQKSKQETAADLSSIPDKELKMRFHRSCKSNMAARKAAESLFAKNGNKFKFDVETKETILNAKTVSAELLAICPILFSRILEKWYDGVDDGAYTLYRDDEDFPNVLKILLQLEEILVNWNKKLTNWLDELTKLQNETRMPHPRT